MKMDKGIAVLKAQMSFVWIGIGLLLLLSGCATRLPVPPLILSDYPIPDQFVLTGRATVKYEGGAEYMRFEWQVNKACQTILLNSPLGTHIAEIVLTPTGAVLRQGQKEWRAADAEHLMRGLFKWHLPLKALHYWILGFASPDMPTQWVRYAEGWYLTQADWQLQFSDYVDIGEGDDIKTFPKRIKVAYPDLTINMVMSDWQLGSRYAK